MSYCLDVPIRWADLDPQGHVNNVRLVDFTQEARCRFLRGDQVARRLLDGVVMVSQQVEYIRPAMFSTQPLHIEISTSQVGGARFVLDYQVRQEAARVARVRTIACPFDFAANSPVRMTDAEREFLRSYLAQSEPVTPLLNTHLDESAPAVQVWARWSDGDPYGHINNVAILEWLQEARVAVTTRVAPGMARAGMALDAGGSDAAMHWLVARQDVDYLKQVHWRLEPWTVRMAPVRLGTTSLNFVAEIVDSLTGSVHVRARTVLVCADTTGHPMALPDPIRAALAAVQVAPDTN